MRLWSLHPSYLDPRGIVALWREALLAQAVLAGRTKGYRHHPQLERFRRTPDPSGAIRTYLLAVLEEARRRGYSFDERRIDALALSRGAPAEPVPIEVTAGQLDYECRLLAAKLAARDPDALAALDRGSEVRPHPLFRRVAGETEPWERVKTLPSRDQRAP